MTPRPFTAAVTLALALLLLLPAASAERPRRKRRLRRPGSMSHHLELHRLETGPGIAVRNPLRAYGTHKAVAVLGRAVRAVLARFPGTPDLWVGDLSRRGGGRIGRHRSHRNGRDIDVGYYFADGQRRRRFERVNPLTLDVARTWALFEAMIGTGQVEYLFVRWRLQKPLYEHALSLGWTVDQLKPVFQYPRTAWNRRGIIRHVPGHDDHVHVRFTPGPWPDLVREESPLVCHPPVLESTCETSSSSAAAPPD